MNKSYQCVIWIFTLFLMSNTFLGYAQQKIIEDGAIWKYYDKAEAPPIGWENSTEISAKWKTGPSGLGYGDSAVTTELNYGSNPKKKTIAYYFTKSFVINDPYKFILYELKVKKDDGIILYLNGKEILRKDMPFGDISHNTKATSLIVNGDMEAQLHKLILSPEDLNFGENIISASVHQGRESSTDLIFNLELIGNNDSEFLPLMLKERSIKNIELNAKVKELNYKLENEKKDLELNFAQQTKNSFKTALYIVGAILLLTVLGLASLFFEHKKKIQTKHKRN